MRHSTGVALAAILTLSGCGADQNGLLRPELMKGLIPGRAAAEPALDPVAIARLAQSNLAALQEPVMLTILEDRKAAAVVVPYGRNGAVETWTTQSFTTLAFRDGILTATRGLGVDLMSAETSATRAALDAGGGQAVQTWRIMDGTNAITEFPLKCRITAAGPETVMLASGDTRAAERFDAVCTGAGSDVRQAYWLAEDLIIQSRQWVGPDAGYVTTQLLRR